jgi:hypothetical protein
MFFKRFCRIIGNQTIFFLKGLVIEVGGLGDPVAFTTLQLSHVNMDYYDLQIKWQYGSALIMHHYVPLLSTTRQCMLPSTIL